jgi:TRAP-type C4-dicarboxylate transport system permease small subunit
MLKVVLDVAYILLWLITGVLLLLVIAAIFIPLDNVNITVSGDSGGKQLPLTRTLLLFGLGAATAYFGGFMLILRSLRRIIRTLTMGDPFQPDNVRRLHQIGLTLAVVTGGVWVVQGFVAKRLAPGVMDPQGFGELLTPIFSVLIVFVLAEVFREGARLRRESELTI